MDFNLAPTVHLRTMAQHRSIEIYLVLWGQNICDSTTRNPLEHFKSLGFEYNNKNYRIQDETATAKEIKVIIKKKIPSNIQMMSTRLFQI